MTRAHSLRIRLLGAMLAVFALGLAASLASYRFAFHNIVSDLRARTLQAQARALSAAIQARPDGRPAVELPENWRAVYADRSRTFTYVIRDSSGRAVAWSDNLGTAPAGLLPRGDLPPRDGLPPTDGPDRIELTGAGQDERAVLTTRTPAGYTLVVARGDLSRDTLIDSLVEESSEHLAVLAPFAAFALGLIWIVSGWSLRPVDRASREAALVHPGQPGARISIIGLPREILPLVDAVNGALDRLSQAYAAERRFTADAAHELRTPLTVLALRLQRARLTGTTDWDAIERELGEMRRLVDQLLDLARKESVSRALSADALPLVNLSRVVREVAASLVPLMESAGRRLEVDVPDIAPLLGRAEDLRDMVRNLLDNALRHGRGTVLVRIRAGMQTLRELLVLEVSDEGPGVPAGREETVFDRFCKLDAAAPGSGLGLAIVREVARSHGGEARFTAGRGSIVVALPAAPRPAAAQLSGSQAPPRTDAALSA
ncbi:MAG: sensor histidine kinase [Steroidobacteraceae bacterium]